MRSGEVNPWGRMAERLLLMLSIAAGWTAGMLVTYTLYRDGALDWLLGEDNASVRATVTYVSVCTLFIIVARPRNTRKGRS